MNWKKSQIAILIEMYDDGATVQEIQHFIPKSTAAVSSKIRQLIVKREEMIVRSITEESLVAAIKKKRGSLKLIADCLGISYQLCSGFINTSPIAMTEYEKAASENSDYLQMLCASSKKSKRYLSDRTAVKQQYLIHMNPREQFNAVTRIQMARNKLAGRLSTHIKLGTLLDGRPVRIYQIIEAAGV